MLIDKDAGTFTNCKHQVQVFPVIADIVIATEPALIFQRHNDHCIPDLVRKFRVELGHDGDAELQRYAVLAVRSGTHSQSGLHNAA